MRQSRVYTPHILSPADTVELSGSASHYLSRVLRLSMGDRVTLFNGDGRDYCGKISKIQKNSVLVKLFESRAPGNESPLKITLVQAISRGERMDFSLQKATELGVFCIQPLLSSRVEVRLDDKRLAKRLSHWQGVVISACEQSGRATVPEVKAPLSLEQWVALGDKPPCLVLEPAATIKLSSFSIKGDAVSILVGPEGGFSDEELGSIRTNAVTAVSFGPRILRTETAGPAAIAVLQSMAGDG